MGKSGTAFTQADTIAYGYNDKSEVTSAVAQNQATYNYGFNFDAIGNRLSSTTSETGTSVQTSYTANPLNQYSLINDGTPKTPSYDFDGNTLSVGDGWVYEYNGANRMVKATNGTTVMEFGYDYTGREIFRKKTESGTVTSHIRYVWDVMNKIEELDALDSNSIMKKYVWGLDVSDSRRQAGGVGALLSENNGNGAFYALYDANGNVTEYLNPSGNISAHYEYSPFGKVTVATGSSPDDFSFRFSTKELEQNTGLVLYQMRPYSSITGRWFSRDPMGERGGINLQEFVSNNPVDSYDYLGLARCCVDNLWREYNEQKLCCKNNQILDLYSVCIRSNTSHSWIYSKNLNTGEEHTYGRWRETHHVSGKSGVKTDAELNYKSGSYSQRCKSVCGYSPTINSGYGTDGQGFGIHARKNNCTSYACEEWQSNTGEDLYPGTIYHDPGTLQDSIQDANLKDLNNPLNQIP